MRREVASEVVVHHHRVEIGEDVDVTVEEHSGFRPRTASMKVGSFLMSPMMAGESVLLDDAFFAPRLLVLAETADARM